MKKEQIDELMEDFAEMTKRLIDQVTYEDDLAAISPDLIKEIRECVWMLYH